MRDHRFVAVHCGGRLDLATHRRLAAWAADCAEHVLPLFEKHSSDDQPRRAINAARAWARGEIGVGDARNAAVGAHAAARKVKGRAATSAARAAGHAVATAHMADHCRAAAIYAVKAVEAVGESGEIERCWQLARIGSALRELIVSPLEVVCDGKETAPNGSVLTALIEREEAALTLKLYCKIVRAPA
jgi:hypothetical protein